jgi:23S rRNA (guanosine2251-2'-O)-methyltransferase
MDPEPQEETVVLEGAISVEAALRAGSREIKEILIKDGKDDDRVLARIDRLARDRSIDIRRVDVVAIDQLASGATHGGIIAVAGPRQFVELNQLASDQNVARGTVGHVPPELGVRGPSPWFVMIDGVEDPYNFGSAVRSAYAAGASGLVVRPRNWFTAAGLIARASAGATELIPTAIAETAEIAADAFKSRGYVIACADEGASAVSLYEAELKWPLFLLIGGEKRGVTRSFKDQADVTLQIPYGTASSNSLGTAAATAVISFEILRQRIAAGDDPRKPATFNNPRPPRPSLLTPRRR